jgi:hypothetical protein
MRREVSKLGWVTLAGWEDHRATSLTRRSAEIVESLLQVLQSQLRRKAGELSARCRWSTRGGAAASEAHLLAEQERPRRQPRCGSHLDTQPRPIPVVGRRSSVVGRWRPSSSKRRDKLPRATEVRGVNLQSRLSLLRRLITSADLRLFVHGSGWSWRDPQLFIFVSHLRERFFVARRMVLPRPNHPLELSGIHLFASPFFGFNIPFTRSLFKNAFCCTFINSSFF